MKPRVLLVLMAGLLVPAAVGAADVKEELKMLEGNWLPVEAELGARKIPIDNLKKLVIKGDRYTVQVGDVTDQGTIKVAPSQKPKAMDIIGTEGPNKGKTILAIYELAGDSLKVCYALEGQARPAEFKTGGDTKHFLVTYKREKP